MPAYKIRDIQANPFRHIDRYPIREDKIAALRESLRTTGFWDNVVGRIGPDGRPQIAYGHHRREALRREYKPTDEVNLIIRDLPDDQMLKIMARENMEEWGSSAAVEHETVRAVVEAYGEGKIALPKPTLRAAGVRYAPSFSPDSFARAHESGYTAQTVADFLGWLEPSGKPQDKVHSALAALQFIEEGILRESDFAGLTTKQAEAVVEQARRAKAANEARAREQQQAAERARKEAEAAEKQRAEAEKQRREAEKEARAAKEAEQKRMAEQRAAREREREDEQKRKRQEAERRQKDAEKRARDEREKGRSKATATGRHVAQEVRAGRGYRNAAEIASEVRDKQDPKLPYIEQFANQLASRLNKLLDPDFDERARDLDRVLTHRQQLSDASCRELDIVLGRIIERVVAARQKLAVHPLEDIVDAEIVDAKEITS
jgi:flagellar biosynthesis GTPase FlhF